MAKGKRKSKAKPLTKSQASAVKSIASRTLNKRAEKKYHLYTESSLSTSYASYHIQSLTDVPQETTNATDTKRDGDSIYARTVRVQGRIYINQTTPADSIVRVLIFRWLPNSGNDAPDENSILSSAYTATARNVVAPYHHDMRRKYKVLYDKRFLLNENGPSVKLFDTKYLMLRHKINYVAGSTTSGANKIYILVTSDNNTNIPVVSYVSKFTLNDM